jgi:acetyl esterase
MLLNKAEQIFFDLLAKRETEYPSKPLSEQSISELRKGGLILTEFAGEPADVAMQNYFIAARDGYQIPIRIFNADIKTTGPLLIMFPGGGYVMDTFEANAIACSRIAKFSGQKVILVNYRLVPENPMPTPMNDAFDVVKYIAKHPDEFQLNPAKLSIGGLSAGAHYAAVISYLSQQDKQIHIDHQILLNGAYDALLNKRYYADYEAKDLMVSREGVNHIYKLWGIPREQLCLPMYSPCYVEDVSKLPRTTILIGEFDGMRSDSEAYFQKLQKGGCQVSKRLLLGECHHTMLLRGAITEGDDPAKIIAEILNNT